MAVIPVTESVVLLNDGSYEVECIDAEPDQLENPQWGSGDIIRFQFKVIGEFDKAGEPVILDPIATAALTPQTKLWSWSIALGEQPVIGEDFDTDRLLNKRALAQVKSDLKPDGTKGFPKIKNLIPLPKSTPKGRTRTQANKLTAPREPTPPPPAGVTIGEFIELLREYRSAFPGVEGYDAALAEMQARWPETKEPRGFFPQRLRGQALDAAMEFLRDQMYLAQEPGPSEDEEPF